MKVIHGPRASGKTYQAVHEANELDGRVVVSDTGEKNRVIRSDGYPDPENPPLTYMEALNMVPAGNPPLVIDNLEHFLFKSSVLGPNKVGGVTVTTNEVIDLDPNGV